MTIGRVDSLLYSCLLLTQFETLSQSHTIAFYLYCLRVLFSTGNMSRRFLNGLKAEGQAINLRTRSYTKSSPRIAAYSAYAPARRFHASTQHSKAGIALPSTTTAFPSNHERVKPIDTPYFLDNKFVNSTTDQFIDLNDPATNNLVTRVPQMTDAEMKAAVASAEKAFETWGQTTVITRQQLMFRFIQLIRENFDRLAASCTIEQGKTLADARGDVLRGIQIAEAAIAAPELLKGEVLEVSKDMETRSYREPLGVVAAICPFSKRPSSY